MAETVRERAEAMLARDRTCQSLGITLDEAAPGRAVLTLRLTEQMVNGHGTAHGGYLFLLADAAFAYACNSHGPVAVAQTAQVTFLRPAGPGDELVAEAVERVRSGRTGLYDVTVRRPEDGAVIAEFRGQSVMLSGKPPAPPPVFEAPETRADQPTTGAPPPAES
ncbi:MAG: phenylacetic acid degradation protein PaaD [Catenulispora sp. 13_1_20CM_3_70_7]|nr:MAG: phenylacetic acid degradation protein PaaD [Catenulispora sp. 13_1_20CM_3_70_7]